MNKNPRKHPLGFMRHVSAVVGTATLMSIAAPTGCTSSTTSAPQRYHLQNSNSRRPFLSDTTVERLQACAEEFAGNLEDGTIRVDATVRVNQDGRIQKVIVEGVPDNAPDLAACTRIALFDMAVPALPLRLDNAPDEKEMPTPPAGNELANPILLGEALVLLAEFMAQHGGRAILYAVAVEVVAATAVAGAHELRRRRRNKDNCVDGYERCVESPLYYDEGKHIRDTRCDLCRALCVLNKGEWPAMSSLGRCM